MTPCGCGGSKQAPRPPAALSRPARNPDAPAVNPRSGGMPGEDGYTWNGPKGAAPAPAAEPAK